MRQPRLTFWHEYASTYSYIAAARIGDRAAKGEFIPNSTISEADAEKTTGVDFDGDLTAEKAGEILTALNAKVSGAGSEST